MQHVGRRVSPRTSAALRSLVVAADSTQGRTGSSPLRFHRAGPLRHGRRRSGRCRKLRQRKMANFKRQTPQDARARSSQVIQKQMSRAARSNQRQRLVTDKLRMVRMTTGRLFGRGRLLRRTTPPGHDSDRPTTSQGKHNTQKSKKKIKKKRNKFANGGSSHSPTSLRWCACILPVVCLFVAKCQSFS